MDGAVAKMLNDGRRLHLQHGPIDLIIEAEGSGWQQAYELAQMRFQTVLSELVEELAYLRQPTRSDTVFTHRIANRMQDATRCFLPRFITPMAAVAGAVGDEILGAMKLAQNVEKIYVNNGGDIAFHLSGEHTVTAAIAARIPARLQIHASDLWRGVATSGWRGRSHSLGIGDSVTVIAQNAAKADAAATLIANEIDLPGHRNIHRQPANKISPDSDLGERLVTTEVGELNLEEITQALSKGVDLARSFVNTGLIGGAMLVLKDEFRQVGARKLITTQIGEPEYA